MHTKKSFDHLRIWCKRFRGARDPRSLSGALISASARFCLALLASHLPLPPPPPPHGGHLGIQPLSSRHTDESETWPQNGFIRQACRKRDRSFPLMLPQTSPPPPRCVHVALVLLFPLSSQSWLVYLVFFFFQRASLIESFLEIPPPATECRSWLKCPNWTFQLKSQVRDTAVVNRTYDSIWKPL